MATTKSYTDIEQSRKLAEILPLESADGFWEYHDKWYSEGDEWEGYEDYPRAEPYFEYTRKENEWKEDKSDIPCWSIAVLLGVLPRFIDFATHYTFLLIYPTQNLGWVVEYSNHNDFVDFSFDSKNLIDACVDMIEKLHELNLL